MSPLVNKIRTEMEGRPKAWRCIADFVIREESRVLGIKLRDLSLEAGVSEGSIINFVRSLGYPGFVEFKVALAQSRGEVNPVYSLGGGDSLSSVLESAREALSDAAALDPALIRDLAKKLTASRVVAVIGKESSHYIAEILAGYLARIGITAFAAAEPHSVVKGLSQGDALIAISYSGETEDIIRSAMSARERGVFVAAITSFPNSSLSSLSDISLSTRLREAEEGEFPLIARIVQLALIYALCSSVISIKNQANI